MRMVGGLALETVATLALVALVVLSGCSGVVPLEDATGTPQPTDRTPPELPPGVAADGVTDGAVLLSAHRRALVEEGFVLTTETTRREPGGPNVTTRRQIAAAPELSAHRHAVTREFDGGRTVVDERWSDGSTGVRRVRENGTVAGHGSYEGADAPALARVNRLRWFLRQGDFEMTTTASRQKARYLLRADGPLAVDDGERGHLSVRLVATPAGRIESLVATSTRPGDSSVGVESYEYHLRETGNVTVAQPDWAGREAGGRVGREAGGGAGQEGNGWAGQEGSG